MIAGRAFRYLREEGLRRSLSSGYSVLWFLLCRKRFKVAGRVVLKGSFRFLGKSYIALGSLIAGERIWIEAVTRYGSQRFFPRLLLGRNLRMTDDVRIGCTHRVRIGDDVLLGSHILITDHDHGIYSGEAEPHSLPTEPPALRALTSTGRVVIEDRVHIGSYVTVCKNVRIGRGAVIGAHSVVTGDIPPYSIAAGIPARVISTWDSSEGRWYSAERVARG